MSHEYEQGIPAASSGHRPGGIQSLALIDVGGPDFRVSLIGEASELLAQDPRASARLLARRLSDEETKLRLTERLIDSMSGDDGWPRQGLSPSEANDLQEAHQRRESVLWGIKALWLELKALAAPSPTPASPLAVADAAQRMNAPARAWKSRAVSPASSAGQGPQGPSRQSPFAAIATRTGARSAGRAEQQEQSGADAQDLGHTSWARMR